MAITKGTFKFHPVGQGCFYSGEIQREDGSKLNFVYDCGKLKNQKPLTDAIAEYKKNSGVTTLDYLFISHFDKDHVSGVISLLTSDPKIYCKRLVIPYYNIRDRVYALIRSSKVLDNFRSFLQNPVAFFAAFENVGEVIVIIGSEDEADFPDLFPPADTNPETASANISGNREIDEGTDYIAYSGADNEAAYIYRPSVWADFPKAKLAKLPYRICVGNNLWDFFIYLQKGIANQIEFGADIEKILKLPAETDKLFEKSNLRSIKASYLDFVKKYKPSAKEINSTSLILYHGPIYSIQDYQLMISIKDGALLNHRPGYSGGTLLTGDIYLSNEQEIIKLKKYYFKCFDRILFFQVPHHGSIKNWLIIEQPHDLHGFEFYVINYGILPKQSPHHPNQKVIDDLTQKCPKSEIIHNNETNDFIYNISILTMKEFGNYITTLQSTIEVPERMKLIGKIKSELEE